jgi:hypothetical protein
MASPFECVVVQSFTRLRARRLGKQVVRTVHRAGYRFGLE